jgi:hypothetical protein
VRSQLERDRKQYKKDL